MPIYIDKGSPNTTRSKPLNIAAPIHAVSQKNGYQTASNNWKWVTGVTMTAIRPNSVYHITVGGVTSANGSSTGKGIPYIRIQRGNTNTYVGSSSNGIKGRRSENTQFPKTNYDDRTFSFTVQDSPGLRTGDTVTYSLQLKCSTDSGTGSFNANMGAIFGNETGDYTINNTTPGASLFVKEIEADSFDNEVDPDIIGRENN